MNCHPGSLPIMEVLVGERSTKALVDTGCMTTLVTSRLLDTWGGKNSMLMVDGRCSVRVLTE